MTGATTAQRDDRTASPPPRPPAGRWSRRLTRRGALALLVVFALLVAAAAYLLYGSPWLKVRRVQVSGTRVLTPSQVARASGVRDGEALVSVRVGAVEARLRAALPRIASVSVERTWPDRIAVRVTERTPKALLEKAGGFVEVDAGGVRYATDRIAPAGVPLVELTGSAAGAGGSDGGYFTSDVLVHAAVQVAADIPESVHKQTRIIQVASFDGITLELTGGRSVLWGGPQDGAQKAAALAALLRADKRAVHYDVSAPTAPASSGS